LLYQLEQGPTEVPIIKAATQNGYPLPNKIANAPQLSLGLELYMQAFQDLTSCRAGTYNSEGPIPWNAIHHWAFVRGLSEEQFSDTCFMIGEMDEVYLAFKTRKLKEAMNSGAR
jgi:hypothetical protein